MLHERSRRGVARVLELQVDAQSSCAALPGGRGPASVGYAKRTRDGGATRRVLAADESADCAVRQRGAAERGKLGKPPISRSQGRKANNGGGSVWLRVAQLVLGALTLSLAAGCSTAHYELNEPLTVSREHTGYAMRNLRVGGNSDSLLILVAFSGGGYRAAALSFAVMELLRETRIEWDGQQTTLLEEVDFISAVSGGSLTAAYYALHRDRLFRDFESKVLLADLQASVLQSALSPIGLWRQTSARYGRGDLLQEVLEERVFGGATFGDVPRKRPLVFINAADMQFGDRFEFTQDQFDHICSDLDKFRIARAVAASMAVPVVLSPITLWNYASQCTVSTASYPLPSRAHNSRYIHLMDGGIADNTGVRTPLEIIGARGGIIRSARLAGLTGIRKRVFIIVNAQLNDQSPQGLSADTPGLLQQVRRAVDVPIDHNSESSIAQLRTEVRKWRREIQVADDQELSGALSRSVEFDVVEIDMLNVDGHEGARTLRGLSSGLRMSAEELSAVRSFARSALDGNADWRHLLRQLQPSDHRVEGRSPLDVGQVGALSISP